MGCIVVALGNDERPVCKLRGAEGVRNLWRSAERDDPNKDKDTPEHPQEVHLRETHSSPCREACCCWRYIYMFYLLLWLQDSTLCVCLCLGANNDVCVVVLTEKRLGLQPACTAAWRANSLVVQLTVARFALTFFSLLKPYMKAPFGLAGK